MGSIIEKLNYLSETVDMIKPKYLKELFNCETTREHTEQLMTFVHYLAPVLNSVGTSDEFRKYQTPTGFTLQTNAGFPDVFVAPKTYDTRILDLPFVIAKSNCVNAKSTMTHWDFSGYERGAFAFRSYNLAVRSLILPKNFWLRGNTFYGAYIDTLFSLGLKLGQYSYNCSSSWCSSNCIDYEKFVDCDEDFYGTIYLSKLGMSAETMVRLFSKLKDLTETGESYTFNIGTTNLAKLTEEQLAIAKNKGWEVT